MLSTAVRQTLPLSLDLRGGTPYPTLPTPGCGQRVPYPTPPHLTLGWVGWHRARANAQV